MFTVITIKHSGPPLSSDYFKVNYKNSTLEIRITYGHSILPVEPVFYSLCLRGFPVFHTAEPKSLSDGSVVKLSTYVIRLTSLISKLLAWNYTQITTEIDMLRHLFMIGNMNAAKRLLESMPDCGDVEILKFIAENEKRLNVNSTEHDSRYKILLEAVASSRPEPARWIYDGRNIDSIINVCGKASNDQTMVIFILYIIDLIDPEYIPSFIDKINLSDLYLRVYLNIKVYDKLATAGLKRMAVYKLITTAMCLEHGQDLKLRGELIKLALSQITCGKWLDKFLQLINTITPHEVQNYFSKMINMMIPAKRSTQSPLLCISSRYPLFSIAAFKQYHTNACTGCFLIRNDYKVMIDGIYTKNNEFIPVFSNFPSITIYLRGELLENEDNPGIDLKYFLLADGSNVPINKSYKIIKSNGRLLPQKITWENSQAVINFEIVGSVGLVELDRKFGEVERRGNDLKVTVNKDVLQFVMEVEVVDGIYEEQMFNI